MPKLSSKTAKSATSSKRAVKKPAAQKPATEATEISFAERVSTQRKLAAEILEQAKFSGLSVPIKTMLAFKRTYKAAVSAHAIARKPSVRQAAALAVACHANGVKPADKASFKRKFEMRGNVYAIENGALSDAISSGLASYDSKTETVTLLNVAEMQSQLGQHSIKI